MVMLGVFCTITFMFVGIKCRQRSHRRAAAKQSVQGVPIGQAQDVPMGELAQDDSIQPPQAVTDTCSAT